MIECPDIQDLGMTEGKESPMAAMSYIRMMCALTMEEIRPHISYAASLAKGKCDGVLNSLPRPLNGITDEKLRSYAVRLAGATVGTVVSLATNHSHLTKSRKIVYVVNLVVGLSALPIIGHELYVKRVER